MHRLRKPLNMAFGYGDNVTGSNTRYVALYNNSPGTHLLCVHDFNTGGPGEAGQILAIAHVHGLKGTLVTDVAPYVTGQAMPYGELYNGDSTTSPETYSMSAGTGQPVWWPHDWPFTFIQPGWSLGFFSDSSGQEIQVAIMWEQVSAEDFAALNGPLPGGY